MGREIEAKGRIEWDEGKIRVLLSGPDGEVSTEVQKRARAVQRRAQSRAPFRTGELRSSITVNTRYPPEGAVAEIAAESDHALVIEFGRRRVTPNHGKFLHWTDGGEVFTQAAAAVAGKHFMRDALDEVE